MGTITISMSGPTANATRTWNLSDADLDSLLEFLQHKYPLGPGSSTPTPEQALLAWCDDWLNATVSQQNRFAVSQMKIPPISFVPAS